MTNETLVKKLNNLCIRYIIDSEYNKPIFEERTRKDFLTIISFLGYYSHDNGESLIIKRSSNSNTSILEINKEEVLSTYELHLEKSHSHLKKGIWNERIKNWPKITSTF